MSALLDSLPGGFGLRLDDLTLTPTLAVALLTSTAPDAPCPRCGTPSDRVHSHYHRIVADLPFSDRPVALRVLVRRFRCVDPACPQGIFCERLPGLLQPHARATDRLTDAHRAVGFALGGEAGARLAAHLDMPTSADTLLRRVKQAPDEPTPPPRYVGVDDWALRKGQQYGTILIDLERGRVIDILPGRDGEALKAWLKGHPQVEVITRDRWAAYAEAATAGAPQAQQVADRWHLLKNLREAVERLLQRREAAVHEALREPDLGAESAATADAQAATEGPLVTNSSTVSNDPGGGPSHRAGPGPNSDRGGATLIPAIPVAAPPGPSGPAAAAGGAVSARSGATRARAVVAPDRPGGRPVGQERAPLPAAGAVPGLEPGPTEGDPTGRLGLLHRQLDRSRRPERGGAPPGAGWPRLRGVV